jgi:hypothetical protein
MTMKRKILIACCAALGLAACGKVGDLQPKAGQAMPAKAYGQTEASSAEQLSTPSIQARPGRSDELMRRSERRRGDPFDLPPGEDPRKAAPPPAASAESTEEKPD